MQLAFEMTFCVLKSKSLWLTPYTNVASAPSHGADTMTSGAPRLEVVGGGVALGEEAGGLDDDVDAEVAPRQVLRVALAEHAQLVAVDADAALGGLDRVAAATPSTESYFSRCAICRASRGR